MGDVARREKVNVVKRPLKRLLCVLLLKAIDSNMQAFQLILALSIPLSVSVTNYWDLAH